MKLYGATLTLCCTLLPAAAHEKKTQPRSLYETYSYLYECDDNECQESELADLSGPCDVGLEVLDPQIGGFAICKSSNELDATDKLTPAPDFVQMDPSLPTSSDGNTPKTTITFDEADNQGGRRLQQEDEWLSFLQWHLDAVNAKAAWSNGLTGSGITIAVIDDGLDYSHPDLSRVNEAMSADFTGEGYHYRWDLGVDRSSHSSQVAGIIGAADNAYGTIGIAPEVELVHVKVLSDADGGGSYDFVIRAILHAVSQGVDVINMSLGSYILKGKYAGRENSSIASLRKAVCGAIKYATQQGVTVVVAGGNDSLDMNSGETAQVVNLMGVCPDAIVISATGPEGWAIDSTTSLYEETSYSNYGMGSSAIDFGGPGGNFDLSETDEGWAPCTVGFVTRPCFVFDMVFSTVNGGWGWSAGTSMASPAAAAIAALLIQENGGSGSLQPSQVKAKMQQHALDLGKNGRDDVFGKGHVAY